MKELLPSYYFDLTNFAHKALFEGKQYVWEALSQIDSYLSSLTLGGIEGEVDSRAYLVNPELIHIGKGTIVEPGAYIKGPCWIGSNCTVRHGAYVRGQVITGDDCVIGHDTELKNVILLNKAHAAHFAYVGDSILGNGVNLGAGTKCANLKLDGKEIRIHFQGKRISSGRRKFGAILGDGVQIGCNTVTNPGTLMGPKSNSYPCLNVGGVIPAGVSVQRSVNYHSAEESRQC